MEVHIKRVDKNTDIASEWNLYVESNPKSQLYHLWEWKEIIQKTSGHPVYNFFAQDSEGKIRGVFPFTFLKSRLFGRYCVSLPYFNHGGMLGDSAEIEQALLDAAIETIEPQRATHLEIRCHAEKPFDLPVKTSKVAMYLDLPDDPEQLFKSFSSKLRSQIRRPEKEGMDFKAGGGELLSDFYEVFAINMRDLGTPVYTKKFFQNIMEKFSRQSWLGVVYYQGQPVASGLVIGYKKMMEIPWASSLRAYNRLSPNMMLYWGLLKLAIEKGYTCFDFGRSTPGDGTHKFKQQWGTRQHQLYWYYWLRGGDSLPELNPDNPTYKLAISIWQKLPIWLTKIIGPSIVKNLP